MPQAPAPGKYIVGDETEDGHTHELVVGTHVLDQEHPDPVPSLIPGDFPLPTRSAYVNEEAQTHPHAHSIHLHPVTGAFLCISAGSRTNPHIHTKFKKVE